LPTLPTLTCNRLIIRKKSSVGNGEDSVGNGESSVGNRSGSFIVAHTGNATIWKTQCPNGWDKTSQPLGQPASTGVTTIGI
jgi:hypothetical protein